MNAHWIPNLRRDLPISVGLLIIATAAVVPGTIAVILALAAITGLMLLRLSRGPIGVPRRSALPDTSGNAASRTSNRGGARAASTA